MKIAEASEYTGLSSDTLRYYERIGIIPPVNRNDSGIRNYDENDIRWIEFVKCMRSAGLPIEVLIEYLNLVEQGDGTIEDRKEILKNQREQLAAKLAEIQRTLDILDYKIDAYEKAIRLEEQNLRKSEGVPA